MQPTSAITPSLPEQIFRYIREPYVVINDVGLIVTLNEPMRSLMTDGSLDTVVGQQLSDHLSITATAAAESVGKHGQCVFLSSPVEASYAFEQVEVGVKLNCLIIQNDHDKAREQTNEYEQRFRDVFNGASTGVAITDTSGRFIEVNQTYCQILGYTETELFNLDLFSITHPEDRARNIKLLNELSQGKRNSFVIEKRYIGKDENIIWVRMSVSAQRDKDGNLTRLIGICENITDRVFAEQQLKSLLHNLPGMAYLCRVDAFWTILFANETSQAVLGYTPEEIIDNKTISMMEIIHPDDRQFVSDAIYEAIQIDSHFQVEYRIKHANGEVRWVSEQGRPVQGEKADEFILNGYITDITELKASNMALKESQQRFELLSKSTNHAMWDWDLTTNQLWWNESFENLFGFDRTYIKPTIESWTDGIHPDDREHVLNDLQAFIDSADHESSFVIEYRFQRADMSYAHVIDRAVLIRDHAGNAIRMVGGMNDQTQRVELEERLRQAQRLESIGQLTGGVAHDFNNLLTVIQGNAEMIADSAQGDELLSRMSEMIVSAACRGSELTQSLLAFARRQPLTPKPTQVNTLVSKMRPLFSRTLGEQIEVKLSLSETLHTAMIDPGLLENALLNLTINARDAMPSGGTLTIETAEVFLDTDYALKNNIAAGDYIMLAVSDTGTGISKENLKHVFDPLYTTKQQGEGTGLGLAMVYGFVKQSDGHISIYSELDRGTTLKIYLPIPPAASSVSSENIIEEHGDAHEIIGGSEAVLLVEDDEMVREYAKAQLLNLGYEVIVAHDGIEALELIETTAPIDLLFTDVVMPRMNGRELADRALQHRPDIKILFTSGYTENAIAQHGRLEPGTLLLSKPYRTVELARKIRQALAGDVTSS